MVRELFNNVFSLVVEWCKKNVQSLLPLIQGKESLFIQDYLRDLGFPGEYPFVRGVYPSMYRGRLWTMRLFSGHGTPESFLVYY